MFYITRGKVMAKTKKKRKKRTESTPTVRVPCSALLDIVDEINDLTAALGCLPELRMMSSTMRDIIQPPNEDRVPSSADGLGQCALKLFDKRLDKYLCAAGNAFIKRADMVCPTEMADMVDMIPDAVRWRLYRLEALIVLLKEEKLKP